MRSVRHSRPLLTLAALLAACASDPEPAATQGSAAGSAGVSGSGGSSGAAGLAGGSDAGTAGDGGSSSAGSGGTSAGVAGVGGGSSGAGGASGGGQAGTSAGQAGASGEGGSVAGGAGLGGSGGGAGGGQAGATAGGGGSVAGASGSGGSQSEGNADCKEPSDPCACTAGYGACLAGACDCNKSTLAPPSAPTCEDWSKGPQGGLAWSNADCAANATRKECHIMSSDQVLNEGGWGQQYCVDQDKPPSSIGSILHNGEALYVYCCKPETAQ